MGEIQHPSVAASWETRGYWEGADRGELVLQRCGECHTVQHRPRAICASCLSSDIEHFVASGRGRVYTFTVTNQNQMPGFREACPYVLAYVELEEGPRLMTNIVGCDPTDVSIGMAVEVDFAPPASGKSGEPEGFSIPRFKPA
jgi:uncharacterized OB-fold protein